MSFHELTLHVVLLAVYGYALYLSFRLTRTMYGGRLTSVLPPFVAAVALIFLMQVLEFVFSFTPAHDSEFLQISVQMMQLVAGFLFIGGLYQLYQVGFATAGFLEADK